MKLEINGFSCYILLIDVLILPWRIVKAKADVRSLVQGATPLEPAIESLELDSI